MDGRPASTGGRAAPARDIEEEALASVAWQPACGWRATRCGRDDVHGASGTSNPAARQRVGRLRPDQAVRGSWALTSISFALERSTNIERRFITGAQNLARQLQEEASPSRH